VHTGITPPVGPNNQALKKKTVRLIKHIRGDPKWLLLGSRVVECEDNVS